MDLEFEVREERRDGVPVVRVRGEVDVATAPALRESLDGAVDGGPGTVVVDLSEVTFIDSTGLGVLIGARKRCVDSGRAFRVVVADPRILKVFQITGLDELFTIHPALEPALGS